MAISCDPMMWIAMPETVRRVDEAVYKKKHDLLKKKYVLLEDPYLLLDFQKQEKSAQKVSVVPLDIKNRLFDITLASQQIFARFRIQKLLINTITTGRTQSACGKVFLMQCHQFER